VIDIKQSSTLVRLRDRETVRISGLLQNKDQTTLCKIPILGDIPFLGALFRWEYKTKLRKELVIFITPKVL
jgi:type II secretory pathway component HofQ